LCRRPTSRHPAAAPVSPYRHHCPARRIWQSRCRFWPSRRLGTGNQSLLINHLARHAAVDREIGAGHEAGAPAVEQKRDDLGNIFRLADAAAGMLSIDASQRRVIFGFDPARIVTTICFACSIKDLPSGL
jgi:hypothetical protein